jgi:hypothetical protein
VPRSLPLRHTAVLLVTISVSTLDALDQATPVAWAGTDDPAKLEVHTEPSGGVRASATLHLPAPPSVVQQVLTDYAKWPELFGVPLRLAHLERQGDRVLTDLYLSHALLVGERRLLCENLELPGGGLVTSFLAGDFRRYSRTWRLMQDGNEGLTRAEFELLVEVDTWAPDWLMALELRHELDKHFRILRERVGERLRSH